MTVATIANGAHESPSLLDELREFLARYVSTPYVWQQDVIAAWILHTYGVTAHMFRTSPRLVMLSTRPGCGKTVVLEIIEQLAPEAALSVSPTSAAVFQMLDAGHTVLLDEVDALGTAKGRSEEMRAVLNAGYREGQTVARVTPIFHTFTVFGPVAIAGLGHLPPQSPADPSSST